MNNLKSPETGDDEISHGGDAQSNKSVSNHREEPDLTDQPPSRPPRTHRKRQLMESTKLNKPNTPDTFIKYSNQSINQQLASSSSSLSLEPSSYSVKKWHAFLPKITATSDLFPSDLHSVQVLFNVIVDKHQSLRGKESRLIKMVDNLLTSDNQVTSNNQNGQMIQRNRGQMYCLVNSTAVCNTIDACYFPVNCHSTFRLINYDDGQMRLVKLIGCSVSLSDNIASSSFLSPEEETVNLVTWIKPEVNCYPFFNERSTLPFCLFYFDHHYNHHHDNQTNDLNIQHFNPSDKLINRFHQHLHPSLSKNYCHHQMYHLTSVTQWLDHHDLSKHWLSLNFPLNLTITSSDYHTIYCIPFNNIECFQDADNCGGDIDDCSLNFNCPFNQVKCLTFNMLKHNWCNTVWTRLSEIIGETGLKIMAESRITSHHPHHLSSPLISPPLLDTNNLLSVNREIYQDLQLIVNNSSSNDGDGKNADDKELNMNCQQAGTETGLHKPRQTESTSPLPPSSYSSRPPPSSSSLSTSSFLSSNYIPSPPPSPELSAPSLTSPDFIQNQIKTAGAAAELSVCDNNDDEKDDCGGTGNRRETISRGSRYSSWKEAVSSDDDDDDCSIDNKKRRSEPAPIRNQSEEESYTQSELENSCKVDQFALNRLQSTFSSQSSATLSYQQHDQQQQPTTKTNCLPSEPTLTTPIDPPSEQTVTSTFRRKADKNLINIDCNYTFNGLHEIGNSSINGNQNGDNTTENHSSSRSLGRSSFPNSSDDQSEPFNCQNPNININAKQNQQSKQLSLLTCLPIQPTVNAHANKLSLSSKNISNNKYNKSNSFHSDDVINTQNANHNLHKSTLISPSSSSSNCASLLTVKEVNYNLVESRLAASNHQHNQHNQINLSLPGWTFSNITNTTTTKSITTTTCINTSNSCSYYNKRPAINGKTSTRADKLFHFSSFLPLSSSTLSTVLLSTLPRGLSTYHHSYQINYHPLILSLCFNHHCNSIVDNHINQIIPGLLDSNNNNNHSDDYNVTISGKLTQPTSYYLDLLATTTLLKPCSSLNHIVTSDVTKSWLIINHQSNSQLGVNDNLINSENCESIQSQYPSTGSHLAKSSSFIDGKCNIWSPDKQSTSSSSLMTNERSTSVTAPLSNQSVICPSFLSTSSSFTNGEENEDSLNNQYYRFNDRNQEKEDSNDWKTMSFYKASPNGHKKSSSPSTALLNTLTHQSDDEVDDGDEEEYNVDDDDMGSTSSDDSFPPPVLPGHSLGGIYDGFASESVNLNNNNYGNPLAYSLHTIIEESCEESEPESLLSRISDHYVNHNHHQMPQQQQQQQQQQHHYQSHNTKGQINSNNNLNGIMISSSSDSSTTSSSSSSSSSSSHSSSAQHHHYNRSHSHRQFASNGDPGDPENYTAFQIGRNVINSSHTNNKRSDHVSFSGTTNGHNSDNDGDNRVNRNDYNSEDNISETSETLADFGDEDDDEDEEEEEEEDDEELDPITLASSRLEKYFTSGLLGSGAYDYPDDVEFQDDDDPNDLYNQAKRDGIKVEIKMTKNQNLSDKETVINSEPKGIAVIPESSLISQSPATTIVINEQSDESKSTSSPSTNKPTTINHNIILIAKEDDQEKVNNMETADTINSDIKVKSESESTDINSTNNNSIKESNQGQIVNKIVINDNETKKWVSLTNNNQGSTTGGKLTNCTQTGKKEINIGNVDDNDKDNCITNRKGDGNVINCNLIGNNCDKDNSGSSVKSTLTNRKNVSSVTRSIQVKPPAPQPPTQQKPPPVPANQVNNLTNDKNIKSPSSSTAAMSNAESSTLQMDYSQLLPKTTSTTITTNTPFTTSTFKSNLIATKSNQLDDKINSVSVKKESTMNNKASTETTMIRFGPSPQLVRSLLADEKSTNRQLIGTRKRVMLGGSEPCPSNESTSAVPHISVSDYSESFSHRGSIGSSGGEEIFTTTEDDIDRAFAFHNRNQPSLSSFGARSESLSSVYSAAGGGRYGTVTVSGEILFSIVYSQSDNSLELYIKECRNLSPVDSKRNRSDPYVKLYLLPDRSKSGKRKTKVKKHTLNPVFDEKLQFYLPCNQQEGRTLWISVWHSDIFGRNDFLGEVTLPLTKEILKNSGLRWYPLQERIDLFEPNQHNYKGDIFIALKFVPSESSPIKGSNNKNGLQGKLLVLVKEAHNLLPTRSNGTSDPFVKCYLLPDKSKKHKTSVIKKTVNPRWNHTFEFDDVNTNDLKDRCLELTVWDYDKLTSNDFLGGVRLSLGQGVYEGKPVDWLDSSDEEMILWKQMLDRIDMWVYGELRLRSSLKPRCVNTIAR